VYFGLSVSPSYLEATVNVAALAKDIGGVELFVNMSQMTVGREMSATVTSKSQQQKLHWLAEQVLNWSGLPVVHVRPTVFLEHPFFRQWAAHSLARTGLELRLPFGTGRVSPIATQDVARVLAAILTSTEPSAHIGKAYDITGPHSLEGAEVAEEYARALGRPVKYVDVPLDTWTEEELLPTQLPAHTASHMHSMAEQVRENRYDRPDTHLVEALTGEAPMTTEAWVREHAAEFA